MSELRVTFKLTPAQAAALDQVAENMAANPQVQAVGGDVNRHAAARYLLLKKLNDIASLESCEELTRTDRAKLEAEIEELRARPVQVVPFNSDEGSPWLSQYARIHQWSADQARATLRAKDLLSSDWKGLAAREAAAAPHAEKFNPVPVDQLQAGGFYDTAGAPGVGSIHLVESHDKMNQPYLVVWGLSLWGLEGEEPTWAYRTYGTTLEQFLSDYPKAVFFRSHDRATAYQQAREMVTGAASAPQPLEEPVGEAPATEVESEVEAAEAAAESRAAAEEPFDDPLAPDVYKRPPHFEYSDQGGMWDIPPSQAEMHRYYTEAGWIRVAAQLDDRVLQFYWTPVRADQDLKPFDGGDIHNRKVNRQRSPDLGVADIVPELWDEPIGDFGDVGTWSPGA